MIRPLILATAYLLSFSPIAHADSADLIDFLAGQGCAIGPSTRAAAITAGFTEEQIDGLAALAKPDPETIETGDWLVLPPSQCTIRVPVIDHALNLDDPDVALTFSDIDAHAADGDPGCFLDSDALRRGLRLSRGWDNDRATIEYIRLVGASLASGDMAFYGDSPLRTPVGFSLLRGDCAQIPQIKEIRNSHRVLIENFDHIIRENAKLLNCTEDAPPNSMKFDDIIAKLDGRPNTNAWLWMEGMMIVLAAGWYEGMTGTEKGIPRPPLCHYGDS
ncbi:hypothetical protein JJJ17_10965 [Paracoccus caeni]|uniref:Uncharacterized protein n=1 Tax=Paracoccus caeni TaxID=657651 RepID=A0A934SEK1_9RHOB|nr:hypothetical protein [Paracoccus caeni]MBK4216447.1 hypothetical protein [Paracoccus caeni]